MLCVCNVVMVRLDVFCALWCALCACDVVMVLGSGSNSLHHMCSVLCSVLCARDVVMVRLDVLCALHCALCM